jgi:ABC-type multidrug transport system fused ATPase/permease subunit
VHENVLLGRPGAANPREEVEQATRLGGAYDVIQKLPLKFDTNLEPRSTGYSRAGWKSSDNKAFDQFVNAQKPTKLSGGEWQRLAVRRALN